MADPGDSPLTLSDASHRHTPHPSCIVCGLAVDTFDDAVRTRIGGWAHDACIHWLVGEVWERERNRVP